MLETQVLRCQVGRQAWWERPIQGEFLAPFGMSTFLGTEVEDDKTMWVLRDPTKGRDGLEMASCRNDLEALGLELGFCLGLGHGEGGKVVLDFEG